MQAFAGLGYYSRARNLHACARAVAARGGRFPSDEAALRELPGVGPYTAAAIAAIAFDQPAAPVDGNIARILSRLHAFATPIAANRAAIEAAARALTPADRRRRLRAGDDGHWRDDLPSAQPRLAARCPLERACMAARTDSPEDFPPRPQRNARPARVGAAFYARRPDGAFLARRRPPAGLLGSTMELPGGVWKIGEIAEVTADEAPFEASWRRLPGFVEHIFTHFSLKLALFAAPADFEGQPPEGLRWIAPDRLTTSGFSSLMRKAAESAAILFEADPALNRRSDAPSAKRSSLRRS